MVTLSKAELRMVMHSRTVERADKAVVLLACGLLRRDIKFDVMSHASVLVDYYHDSPPWHPVDVIVVKCAVALMME